MASPMPTRTRARMPALKDVAKAKPNCARVIVVTPTMRSRSRRRTGRAGRRRDLHGATRTGCTIVVDSVGRDVEAVSGEQAGDAERGAVEDREHVDGHRRCGPPRPPPTEGVGAGLVVHLQVSRVRARPRTGSPCERLSRASASGMPRSAPPERIIRVVGAQQRLSARRSGPAAGCHHGLLLEVGDRGPAGAAGPRHWHHLEVATQGTPAAAPAPGPRPRDAGRGRGSTAAGCGWSCDRLAVHALGAADLRPPRLPLDVGEDGVDAVRGLRRGRCWKRKLWVTPSWCRTGRGARGTSPRGRAACAVVPGSSKRWVAPGTTARRLCTGIALRPAVEFRARPRPGCRR